MCNAEHKQFYMSLQFAHTSAIKGFGEFSQKTNIKTFKR